MSLSTFKQALTTNAVALAFITAAANTAVATPMTEINTIIDFEEITQSTDWQSINSPYTASGYTFSTDGGFSLLGEDNSGYTGSQALFQTNYNDASTIILEQEDGLTFDFNSIDIAELAANSDFSATFTGTFMDESTISETIFFDADTTPDLETFSFTTFNDITKLTIDTAYQYHINFGIQIDNVSTTMGGSEPVPEPATMLLFGAGLGLLAASRRKKDVDVDTPKGPSIS